MESGQMKVLGLSHAIGPPGWRPYFGEHFLLAPAGPPWPLLGPPGPEVGIERASPKT